MASQATKDVCARVYGWLKEEADPLQDKDLALAELREGYDQMNPAIPDETDVEAAEVGGVPGLWITPPDFHDAIVIFFHGGGFMIGSSRSHGELAARVAMAAKAKTFIADYRRVPDFTFPAPLEDGTRIYRALVSAGTDPARIVIVGDSAGGGLALATVLSLRADGAQLPAGVATMSAWTDMTSSGHSLRERIELDPVVTPEMAHQMAEGYVPREEDRTNPLASPVFADYDCFPPLLMQVGTSEILYDDTIRVAERARAAGVNVEVQRADGMVHVYQLISWALPEGLEAIREIGKFVQARTQSQS
jgi:acetyl esterase/lipase